MVLRAIQNVNVKTVIARFSEVKKLYSENELRGTDEEGLEIDVNKISTALRTAGIDLNKYFLGEVGLDDIFMELASKWDKLTSVQQRYIATQAAGSRQQSRFIALMSNYARTQELVGEAYNSNGAAAKQFAKTQESLESKLARLKNAWNEFAMGILNSDLVKIGVDILTNLLNFVNQLTSAFGALDGGIGGVISSLLKLTALVGGLSLGKNLLNGLFGGKLGEAGGVTGALFSSPSLFKKIGGGAKALWGGIQNIGLNSAASTGIRGVAGTIGGGIAKFFGGSSGAVAGLSGLLTIGAPLAGITAAAALAYKGIKKLYDLSPEGQVKIAEKYAESLHKVADSAKGAADELKSIKDEYANYSKTVDEADNSQDRSKAIQDRNEYITSLLEKNAEYVKYLSTTFEDGEIKLVLDEDAIANAVDRAAEAARKAQGYSSIGDAAVAQKQARLYKTKNIEVDRLLSGDVTLPEQVLDYWFNGKFKNLDSKKAIYESQASKYSEQAKALTQQAIYQLLPKELSTDINGQDIAALIGSKISKIDLTQEISDKLGSLDDKDLKNLYEDYFGAGSAEGLKDDDMRLAIASIEALSGAEEQIDRFLEVLQGPYTDEIREVLSAISGKGVTQNVNLLDPKLDDYDIYLKLLNKLPQEGKDAVSEIIGSFYDELMAAAKAEQKRQKKVVSGLYSNLLTSGVTIDQSYLDQINRFLSPQQLQALYDVTSNFKGLISDDLYKEIFSTEGVWHFAWNEDLDKIQEFVSNFNLDNPINAFLQLKEAKEQATDGSVFQKLLLNIEDTNQSIFESSNLLKTFIQSSEYDELTESVHEFIEENGRLTPKKIEELAKESKTLKTLIDDVGISVNGLAKALTAIDRGALLEGLTQAVLNSFSAVEDFDTALQEMYDTIDNFNPGRSYGEGTEFIAKQLETLQELIDKRSFGGEQFKNIYTLLFGEEAYNEFFRDWGTKGIEEYVEAAQEQLDKLNNYVNYNSFGFMTDMAEKGQLGISFKEGSRENFNWEIGAKTTEDLVKEIQQLGYSKQVAQMLLFGYAEQSYDFSQQLKENDYAAQLKDFANNFKGARVVAEQELDLLAKAYDKDIDTIKDDLYNNGFDLSKIVNWDSLSPEEIVNKIQNISDDIQEVFKDSVKQTLDGEYYFDYDSVINTLKENFNLTQEQAEEIIAPLSEKLHMAIGKMVKTQRLNPETGELEIKYKFVKVDKGEGTNELKQKIEDVYKEVDYNILVDALVNADWEKVGNAIAEGILKATAVKIPFFNDLYEKYLKEKNKIENNPIQINTTSSINSSFGGSSVNVRQSKASGDSFLTTPGWALTGEEGPEIVWNKAKGYSYITGQNGPEFRTLEVGDRIFNAQDTSRILKHSSFAKGGIFGSYANSSGGYNTDYLNNNGRSSGGSGSKPTNWHNELDWLYNLMEDIAELERSQTKLQEQHDRYLEDISKTGRDLYEISNEQLNNLRTQLDNQREALARRRQEMAEQLQASGYTNYVWWNNKDQTIEIDWDAIEAIQDKDTYDAVSDLVSKVEKIQDEMDTAEDALWDIEGTIKEIENRYLEEYTNFQKRIYDAVVNSYQEQIDKLSQLNDTLNDSNNAILNSLQHEIELQRQIRDNTDAENNIRDMEARLAYLRRDTTGANESEIRALEKQLDEARQNYADTLIDQSINRLQESNDKAAEQREKQISLLTAQLDYWKETGALWPEVATLLETGLSEDGALIGGSALEQILRDAEDWKAMSEQQREVWANELITSANQAGAYLLKISEGFDNLSAGIWALIPQSSLTTEKYQYATGGLASYTGPAWLDGTPQEPEYVLNARQTDAFLRLAEVLPSMFGNQGTTVNNLGHDIYVEFNMNVDKITSDYDVDRIVDRVKEDIYNISSYRNVNSISFSR